MRQRDDSLLMLSRPVILVISSLLICRVCTTQEIAPQYVIIDDSDDWEPYDGQSFHPILAAHNDNDPTDNLDSFIKQGQDLAGTDHEQNITNHVASEPDQLQVKQDDTTQTPTAATNVETESPKIQEDPLEEEQEANEENEEVEEAQSNYETPPSQSNDPIPQNQENGHGSSPFEQPAPSDEQTDDKRVKDEDTKTVETSEVRGTVQSDPTHNSEQAADSNNPSDEINIKVDLVDDLSQKFEPNSEEPVDAEFQIDQNPSVNKIVDHNEESHQVTPDILRENPNLQTSPSPPTDTVSIVTSSEQTITVTPGTSSVVNHESATTPEPERPSQDDLSNQMSSTQTLDPPVNDLQQPHSSVTPTVTKPPLLSDNMSAHPQKEQEEPESEAATTTAPPERFEREGRKAGRISATMSHDTWSDEEMKDEYSSSMFPEITLTPNFILSIMTIASITVAMIYQFLLKNDSTPIQQPSVSLSKETSNHNRPPIMSSQSSKDREIQLLDRKIKFLERKLRLAPLEVAIRELQLDNLESRLTESRLYLKHIKNYEALLNENRALSTKVKMDRYERLLQIRNLKDIKKIPGILRYIDYHKRVETREINICAMQAEDEFLQEQMELFRELRANFQQEYTNLKSEIESVRIRERDIERERLSFLSSQVDTRN